MTLLVTAFVRMRVLVRFLELRARGYCAAHLRKHPNDVLYSSFPFGRGELVALGEKEEKGKGVIRLSRNFTSSVMTPRFSYLIYLGSVRGRKTFVCDDLRPGSGFFFSFFFFFSGNYFWKVLSLFTVSRAKIIIFGPLFSFALAS